MVAKHEVREYTDDVNVYIGRYVNLNNIFHWHYDCELVYVASGSLDIYARGKFYTLSAGQSMYIGNMEEHSIRTRQTAEAYMIIFSYDILKGMLKNQKLVSPVLNGSYGVDALYGEIKREMTAKNKYYESIIENKITAVMLDIFRGEQSEPADIKKKDKMAFMHLLDDIDKNYSYYSAASGADFLCVSTAYFSKYFRKMSGMVFMDYLNSVKISKAVELINDHGDHSMSDIASKCGFNTIRNFNRVFKELTGYSPSQLPAGYTFGDNALFPSDSADSFDPTLKETKLIESLGGREL